MDEILLSVTLLSDGKIITWYDLSEKCNEKLKYVVKFANTI